MKRIIIFYHLKINECILFLIYRNGKRFNCLRPDSEIRIHLPILHWCNVSRSYIRNFFDFRGRSIDEKEIETIGGLSLSFFLTMALMGLKLWQLLDLALPLLVMLIAQVVLVGLFAYFIT